MARWRDEAWGSVQRIAVEQPDLVSLVLEELQHGGPMTSLEVEAALAHDAPRQRDQWGWNWSMVKEALEYLFFSGAVGSAGRTAQFERRYDVIERVLPRAVTEAPTPARRRGLPAAHPHRSTCPRGGHASRACATTSGCAPWTPSRRWPSSSSPATWSR